MPRREIKDIEPIIAASSTAFYKAYLDDVRSDSISEAYRKSTHMRKV